MLEVNPRASRTVPFVAKATGMPVAKIAAKVMAGVTWPSRASTSEPIPRHVSVKESVFPVRQVRRRRHRARARDALDRRSDGHQRAVLDRVRQEPARRRHVLPTERQHLHQRGRQAKPAIVDLAQPACRLGYTLLATDGTAKLLEAAGIPTQRVKKISEGHPNLLDFLTDGEVALVMNTPSGKGARTDEGRIRAAAVQAGVPCITTIQAADAAVRAMEALREEEMQVQALQDRFAPA